eukprot:COSAG06_NODE_3367_length_5442_cov_3.104810_4_plen_94_part_00
MRNQGVIASVCLLLSSRGSAGKRPSSLSVLNLPFMLGWLRPAGACSAHGMRTWLMKFQTFVVSGLRPLMNELRDGEHLRTPRHAAARCELLQR